MDIGISGEIVVPIFDNPILDASSSEHYSVQFTRGSKTVQGRFVVMTYTGLDGFTF